MLPSNRLRNRSANLRVRTIIADHFILTRGIFPRVPGILESHIARLRLAAAAAKEGEKERGAAGARRTTLFLSFRGGVGNTFDDF